MFNLLFVDYSSLFVLLIPFLLVVLPVSIILWRSALNKWGQDRDKKDKRNK